MVLFGHPAGLGKNAAAAIDLPAAAVGDLAAGDTSLGAGDGGAAAAVGQARAATGLGRRTAATVQNPPAPVRGLAAFSAKLLAGFGRTRIRATKIGSASAAGPSRRTRAAVEHAPAPVGCLTALGVGLGTGFGLAATLMIGPAAARPGTIAAAQLVPAAIIDGPAGGPQIAAASARTGGKPVRLGVGLQARKGWVQGRTPASTGKGHGHGQKECLPRHVGSSRSL